jgi:hypothetical protein
MVIKIGEPYQLLPIEKNIYATVHDNIDKVVRGELSITNLSRIIYKNLENGGFK